MQVIVAATSFCLSAPLPLISPCSALVLERGTLLCLWLLKWCLCPGFSPQMAGLSGFSTTPASIIFKYKKYYKHGFLLHSEQDANKKAREVSTILSHNCNKLVFYLHIFIVWYISISGLTELAEYLELLITGKRSVKIWEEIFFFLEEKGFAKEINNVKVLQS